MHKSVFLQRWARYAAYGAAGLALLLLAAGLLLRELLGRPGVEAEIQTRLSRAVNGQIAWESLQVRLLPSPRGVVRGVRVGIPGIVSARADQLDARLRLMPLFRGRAEIASIGVSRPAIEVHLAPSGPEEKERNAPPPDPLDAFRSAASAIAVGIRQFAADTELEIDDATVEVRAADLPPIRLRGLSIHAQTDSKGLDLEAAAAGNFWDTLRLSARFGFDDLSGNASLEVAGLKPQVWLDRFVSRPEYGMAVPAASLRAQVRTDGKTSLDGRLDASAAIVEIVRAGERVRLDGVSIKAEAAASADEIAIRLSDAQVGANRLSRGVLRYSQKGGEASGSVGFDLDLPQVMDAVRRMLPGQGRAALEVVQSVAGTASGNFRFAFGRKEWRAGIEVPKADVSVQMRNLPGPTSLTSVAVDITQDAVKVDRAALSLLDASAIASATIGIAPGGPQITGSIAEGSVGGNFLEWVRQIAHLPPNLQLRTPIRVAAPRIAFSPKRALEVEASAQFDAGPAIAVELGWAQDALDLRRLAIKDARSDAAIALRSKGRAIEGKFSGSLYSTSIAAMLKSADLPAGGVTGNLHVKFDRDRPGRGTAEGNLKGEALDLSRFLGRPVKIDRIDLAADNTVLRVREASVNWAGQRATLRGDIRRGARGGIIDAQVDSPGVILDAILPSQDEAAGDKAPAGKEERSPVWPLPLTGRIAVRSDFLQRGRYKLAPVAAMLVLEERRAHLDLTQAQLCGISLPLTIEATPQGVSASARFTAQKQSLEQTARCLSDEQLQITGDFDLKADVRAKGRLGEFARNLEGSVGAELRDGKVTKFALLGKILSLDNISTLLKGEPKLEQEGLPFRNITVNGRFQAGRFLVEEAAFRSNTVGLAATGWISILDYQSRLSVLVAPLGLLDTLVRNIPLVGYVVGGSLTSVPVGVSGDIRDPLVVPLGPSAITSELKGIFERTLKVPSRLLAPLKADPESGAPPDAR